MCGRPGQKKLFWYLDYIYLLIYYRDVSALSFTFEIIVHTFSHYIGLWNPLEQYYNRKEFKVL